MWLRKALVWFLLPENQGLSCLVVPSSWTFEWSGSVSEPFKGSTSSRQPGCLKAEQHQGYQHPFIQVSACEALARQLSAITWEIARVDACTNHIAGHALAKLEAFRRLLLETFWASLAVPRRGSTTTGCASSSANLVPSSMALLLHGVWQLPHTGAVSQEEGCYSKQEQQVEDMLLMQHAQLTMGPQQQAA